VLLISLNDAGQRQLDFALIAMIVCVCVRARARACWWANGQTVVFIIRLQQFIEPMFVSLDRARDGTTCTANQILLQPQEDGQMMEDNEWSLQGYKTLDSS
jgi:hypothetical protein